MKQSKFTDSQIIAALKQAEGGTPVPGIFREYGISTATFYKWRAKYGGLDVSMMAHVITESCIIVAIPKQISQSSAYTARRNA